VQLRLSPWLGDKPSFLYKQEFVVDRTGKQYRKIKENPKLSYVCKHCNQTFQKDAQINTGINPDTIDKYDKFIQ
jgi:transposase-like protein